MLREVVALVAGTSAIINGLGVIGSILSLVTKPPDLLALIQISISIPIQLITALAAASAWRLRLEPRKLEQLVDLKNAATVVSLLNIGHWMFSAKRHGSVDLFIQYMLPALIPEMYLAMKIWKRNLSFDLPSSLINTALDLEILTLCEALGVIASMFSSSRLSRGFSDLALIVSCVQLLGVSVIILAWLFIRSRLEEYGDLLKKACNCCLVLAVISLLTTSSHMTHLTSALLIAVAQTRMGVAGK